MAKSWGILYIYMDILIPEAKNVKIVLIQTATWHYNADNRFWGEPDQWPEDKER